MADLIKRKETKNMDNLFREIKSLKKIGKTGQGSLITLVLASCMGTFLVCGLTSWYLSMHRNIEGLDDRLESISVAMSEWQRLEHMSIEELLNKQDSLKEPYAVGDKYKVKVNLGEKGYFNEGKCNKLEGEFLTEYPNCFSDTTMTIYDIDNKPLYTTRTLPLSTTDATLPKPDWAKSTIVRKGQNSTIDYTFHVPANGIILYSLGGNIGGYRSYRRVIINGTQIYGDDSGDSTKASLLSSGALSNNLDSVDATSMLVSQGDVIRFQVWNTNNSCWNSFSMRYVPYKGAKFISTYNDTSSNSEANAGSSQKADGASLLPKGTILAFNGLIKDIPEGWHLCDGTNGTLNLLGKFLEGSNISGNYIDSGLPNITGYFGRDGVSHAIMRTCASSFPFRGAFSTHYENTNVHVDEVVTDYYKDIMGIYFDASRSNPIYGKSEIVQPPAYTVLFIMKIK